MQSYSFVMPFQNIKKEEAEEWQKWNRRRRWRWWVIRS